MGGGHFKNTAVPSGGSTRLRLRPSGRLPYPFATGACVYSSRATRERNDGIERVNLEDYH